MESIAFLAVAKALGNLLLFICCQCRMFRFSNLENVSSSRSIPADSFSVTKPPGLADLHHLPVCITKIYFSSLGLSGGSHPADLDKRDQHLQDAD